MLTAALHMAARIAPCVGVACILAGCGTLDAFHARSFIPGHTEPDVISCMGPPASAKPTGTPGETIAQWDYTQATYDAEFKLGLYEAELGAPGSCHAVIRFDQGYATSVHFTAVNIGPTNPDSICGRLVDDCLHHIDHTALPPGYTDDALLTGNRTPAK